MSTTNESSSDPPSSHDTSSLSTINTTRESEPSISTSTSNNSRNDNSSNGSHQFNESPEVLNNSSSNISHSNSESSENRTDSNNSSAHELSGSNSSSSLSTEDNTSANDSDLNLENDNHNDLQKMKDAFNKIYKFLQLDDITNPISVPTAANAIEVLLMALKFSIMNSLSNTAVANLFTLLNNVFVEPLFPGTRYLADSVFHPSNNVIFHAVCTSCETYIGRYTKDQRSLICDTCNEVIHVNCESFTNFFATLDPTFQISNLIKNHSQYYNYVTKERIHVPGKFEDVYDGLLYRKIVNSLKRDGINDFVTLVFNTDGAPVFQSSNFSIWPIQVIVNEIPVEERLKSQILCSIWFGKTKPDMNVFLTPFVDLMNDLTNTGFPCTIDGVNRTIRVIPICCCTDSVARAPLQGLVQFNGRDGCNWCTHPGEYAAGAMRYSLDEIYPDRTHAQAILDMQEAVESGNRVHGFVTVSKLIILSYFNIIDGFVPDYLHNVALGVAKKFVSYWIENPVKYATVDNLETVLSDLFTKVKVPVQVARRTRSLDDRRNFKGKEWENWSLLICLPLLQEVLKPQYVKHWAKLVEAMHILLQDNITIELINHADILLYEFVEETTPLYGIQAMTYNVHQLLHLAKSVLNWGPLWSHSGFVFESGNWIFLKKVHSAKGVCNQICRFVSMTEAIKFIEMLIPSERRIISEEYDLQTDSKQTKTCIKFADTRYFGKGAIYEGDVLNSINIESRNYMSYRRIVRHGCLYASCLKLNRRSDNSFVQLLNGTYVQIEEFLLNEDTESELTVVRRLDTSNAFPSACGMTQIVNEISNELSVINTTDITKPCVFIKVLNKAYISALPNVLRY